jgi:hypothetical protein
LHNRIERLFSKLVSRWVLEDKSSTSTSSMCFSIHAASQQSPG